MSALTFKTRVDPSLVCFNACVQCILQIYMWCITCWLLHGRVFLIYLLFQTLVGPKPTVYDRQAINLQVSQALSTNWILLHVHQLIYPKFYQSVVVHFLISSFSSEGVLTDLLLVMTSLVLVWIFYQHHVPKQITVKISCSRKAG